jgi:tRNA G18 (ribose-2'-O)-methylase SpoU
MLHKKNQTIPAFTFFEAPARQGPQEVFAPYIIGHELRSPDNHGALIRLGDNIAAKKVFFTSDPNRFSLNKIKRASGSSHSHMDYVFTGWSQIKAQIPEDYTWLAIETAIGATNVFETRLPLKCVFVVGNETAGLPDEIISACQQQVFIPVPGHTRSMNVSHALGVVLFEWFRQQQF